MPISTNANLAGKQVLGDGGPSGTSLVSSATADLASFWAATPVVRPTSAVAVSTSAPLTISAGFGFATSAQMIALITAVNVLRANSVTTGLATSA